MNALIAIAFLSIAMDAFSQGTPTPTPSGPIKVALRTYSDNDRDFSLLQLYRRVLAENPNVKIVDDKSQADIGVSLVSVEAPFGGTAWSTVVIEHDPNRQPILKGHWLYTSSANDLIKEVRKRAQELSDEYFKPK
jgi:hypothetical protein